VDGASRSNNGFASSARRHAAAPIPSNISSEDRMTRTMRFARSLRSARLACCGAAALVTTSTGCAHSKAADGPAPTATSSRELKSSSEMQQAPNMPIEQYLASRSAGVDIGHAADGTLTVRIRGGSSSTYGNNAPLYIVDGVPFTPSTEGGLSGINPYDIASIRALKDAADITMYGVRGANGVIVIKTKKANQ
jgi:TonB-dependent SusC/RagA subfamily outer membrane receptor